MDQHKPRRGLASAAVLLSTALLAASAAPAQEGDAAAGTRPSDDDVLNMDLDQLSRADVVVAGEMSTEVTSVSRTAQPISRTASAVFVITNEMIRRSGARNVPEALRLAPGVHVGRVNSSAWAISIRGFNSQFATRLLVQIDGRAVYTPIFSGTYWEQSFVPLKDVDRIEVVRGPGGAVWGANSVAGVINIVTKNSEDTQGGYAMAGGGNEHRSFSHARVGGQVGDISYRLYGMQFEDDRGGPYLAPPQDGRNAGQGGFRMDWLASSRDTLTLQGDLMAGTAGYGLPTFDLAAHNVLGRWTRQIGCDSECTVQAYYDDFSRWSTEGAPGNGQIVDQHAYDVDMVFHTHLGDAHDVVFGAGYREYHMLVDDFGAVNVIGIDNDYLNIISYFMQDTITLTDDFAYLTLGSKMEHNSFVGFVYQPAAKLAITPDERTSLWASVARAVRTPSRVERDIAFTFPGTPALSLNGTRSIGAEDSMNYELGIRRQPTEYFYWDLAVFYSKHDHIIGYSATGSSTPPIPTITTNDFKGESYGGELWGSLEMTENWRMRAFYAYLRDDNTMPAAGVTVAGPYTSPRHLAYLTSSHDINCSTTLDMTLRYADTTQSSAGGLIGSYLTADIRLAYQPRELLSLALVGQNLLRGSHAEYLGEGDPASTVQPGVYGMVEWGY